MFVSMAVLGMVFAGVIAGLLTCSQNAEWSAHSLAAESIASQGVEQARAAKWDPQAWPQSVGPGQADELGVTNYAQTATLAIPYQGQPITATNFVAVTTVSSQPAIRQIRADCVWMFMNQGPFTNTVITLRAADQ
jgi:hypothetical protein